MGFYVREYMLPPGTLIRFDGMGFGGPLSYIYSSLDIRPGDIALILKHKKPLELDILVRERIVLISLVNMIDATGWTPEFTPIYCGSGLREYPKWYPEYCYDEV